MVRTFRGGVFVLLVLAFVNGWPFASGEPGPRILVLDVSASVRPAAAGAWRPVGVPPGLPDDLPVLRFAASPWAGTIWGSLREGSAGPTEGGGSGRGLPLETDLGAAIRAAVTILPPRQAGQILLVSDGRDTRGNARVAAEEAAAAGVVIHAWPSPPPAPEIWIESLIGPPRARPGDRIALRAVVASTCGEACRVSVEWERDAASVSDRIEAVVPPMRRGVPGTAVVELRDRVEDPGRRGYFVTLAAVGPQPGATGRRDNDRSAWTVAVGGERRLLVLSPDADGGPVFGSLRAAGETGWRIEATAPPLEARSLGSRDLIVIDSVAAGPSGLSDSDQAALLEFVRARGGGLVTVGDEGFYGPGGYEGSLLEGGLPVVCRPRDAGGRTLLVLLDRSGSMGEERKMPQARAAVAELAREIPDGDRLGVMTFSESAERCFGFERATGRTGVAGVGDALAGIEPRGETDLLGAVQAGLRWLGEQEAEGDRALIVLSDGKAEGDFRAVGLRLLEEGIRVAAVVTGESSEVRGLRELILEGRNGTLTRVEDRDRLGEILLRQWRRGDLGLGPSGVVATGAGLLDLPPLPEESVLRWARTTARPGASVAARLSATGDPFLAAHRLGAGKIVSLLVRPGPPSAPGWDSASLWEAIVRWGLPDVSVDTWFVRVAEERTGLEVDVAPPPSSAWETLPEGLHVRAGGDAWPLTLRADGTLTATMRSAPAGGSVVQLVDGTGSVLDEAPVPSAPPVEIRAFGPDLAALQEIAAVTGGGLHDPGEPPPAAVRPLRPLGPFRGGGFVLAALVLLLAERVLVAWMRHRGRISLKSQAP
jgi:Mg-chelatase subunit ChlD